MRLAWERQYFPTELYRNPTQDLQTDLKQQQSLFDTEEP